MICSSQLGGNNAENAGGSNVLAASGGGGQGLALWCGYFALYLLVYLPVGLRSGLHWDEVFDVAGAANGTYVAAGRWGLALYRSLFGLGYMPWMAGVVAGLFIAAAMVVQTRLYSIRTRFGLFMYGALYTGCVQWASQLQYSHQSDAVGLALLCVSIAVYLLYGDGKKKGFVAAALIIYACAVYQTSMLYLLVLLFSGILAGAGAGTILAWRFWRMLIWVFFSGCAYLVSRELALMLPVLTETDMNYVQCVQHGMSRWPEIVSAPSLTEKCALFAEFAVCYIKVILKNALGLCYEGQWVYATTMIPVCCLLWRWGVREKSWEKVFLLLCVWLMPFVMALVVMTDQGPRVSLAEPLACASIWLLWMKQGGWMERSRTIFLTFASVVVLKGGYRVAVIAEDEKNLYASRMRNLSQLNGRLLAEADAVGNAETGFVFFGEFPNYAPDVYRKRWQKRCDDAVLLRLPDGTFPGELTVPLKKATPDDVRKFGGVVENMPLWPAPGCVTSCGGTVLVKFPG